MQGNVWIESLALRHTSLDDVGLNLDSLRADGVDFGMHPRALFVDSVSVSGADVSLVRREDGKIVSYTPVRGPGAAAGGGARSPMDLQIGEIVLKGGVVRFIDRTTDPVFRADLSQVSGTIGEFSNDPEGESRVELNGVFDASAPIRLEGRLNPMRRYDDTDLNIVLEPANLVRLTPYFIRYLGREVTRGKLEMQSKYTVQSRILEGENRIILDQLSLGRTIESADAVSVPVDLAVALLKNRKGEIDVKIPVRGNLDDPSFRIEGVLFQAFINLLAKAATSPFNVLAALAGTNEELSYIGFEPGGTELDREARERLDQLAEALHARPALTLEIKGSYHPERDGEALRDQALPRYLKAMQLRDPDAPAGDAESDPDTYVALLRYALQYSEWGSLLPGERTLRPGMEEAVTTPDPGEPDATEPENPAHAAASTRRLELQIGKVKERPSLWQRLLRAGEEPAEDRPKPDVMLEAWVPAEGDADARSKIGVATDGRTRGERKRQMDFPIDITQIGLIEAELKQRIPVTAEMLARLAEEREATVRRYLLESANLGPDRLFRGEQAEVTGETPPRVLFRLK